MTKEELEKNIYDNSPKEVLDIFSLFESAGYEIYIVGGYIRDLCLDDNFDEPPHDIDFTTNATPEQIYKLLENTEYKILDTTGIKHGTCRVRANNATYEISTYRPTFDEQEGETYTLEQDLSRRDFTLDTLCYNPKTGIYDPYGVLSDWNNEFNGEIHFIKAVGDPLERFKEDGLRIIRLVRIAHEKSLIIDEETLSEAFHAIELGYLRNISTERIGDELQRLFRSFCPGTSDWWGVGSYELVEEILLNVIPDFEHNYRARILIEEGNKYYSELFWWWLITCHIINNKDRKALLDSFNLDKDLKKKIQDINNTWIGKWKDDIVCSTPYMVKSVLNICRMKEERKCITKEILPLFYGRNCDKEIRDEFDRVLESKEPIYLSELVINGEDILNYLLPKSKEYVEKVLGVIWTPENDRHFKKLVGVLLNEALCEVWECPEENEKETILNWLWDEILQPEIEDRLDLETEEDY